MTQLREFLDYWGAACDRKGVPKLVAEVHVPEAVQSQAAQRGREFLLACSLDPWKADDVLSEISLLTMSNDSEETWRLRRLSGPQAALITGGSLSAHFAKSFILAEWVRPAPAPPSKRTSRPAAEAR